MLDFKCDSLIVDMFKYFMRSLKDNYSKDIYLQMEFILLLLDSMRLDNERISSSAHLLAEKMLANCVTELVPCMCKTIQLMR